MDKIVNPNDVNRIVANTVFKGVFTSENDIRIDGKLEGQIESKGKLVVGPTGVIDGKIVANNADFGGTMNKGSFEIYDTLCLQAGCKVDGDMLFRRIQIELDAKVNGKCRVMDGKKPVPAPAPTPAPDAKLIQEAAQKKNQPQ